MIKPVSEKAGIVSTGYSLPEKILTNYDLEKIVDTSNEWIVSRTGIKERRILEEGLAASDLAVAAGKNAMEQAGISPEELSLIIVGTTSPDMPAPATAVIVQAKLQACNAAAFDLNAGCTGFIYALHVGQQFVENGSAGCVLVIGVDIVSRFLDWEDRSTCVLFGDGAGAVMLQPVARGGIITSLLKADGKGADYLNIPGGGSRFPASRDTVREKLHCVKMTGNDVFKFAVKVVVDTTTELLQNAGKITADLDFLVLHQANTRIIEAARKRLDIPSEKVLVNIGAYGNMSAASIPVALHEAIADGRIKRGDLVALVGFGAGFTWGGTLVEI